MVVESIAITIIITALFFVFLRGKKPKSALSTLPLVIVPVGHLIGIPISQGLAALLSLPRVWVYSGFDVLAYLLFWVSTIILLRNFHSRRAKAAYLIACVLFTSTLVVIFGIDTLSRYGVI